MASQGRKAGWHADPSRPARYRFWDGAAWTHWVSPSASAPLPPDFDADAVAPVRDRADRTVTAMKWTALAVAVIVIATTAVGIVLNRRDLTNLAIVSAEPPAVTLSSPGPDDVRVTTDSIMLGTAVTVPAPAGWAIEEPSPAVGLFDPIAFMKTDGPKKANLPDTYVGVGIVVVTVLPDQARATAASLVQVSAGRLYSNQEGVQVSAPTTAAVSGFGPEHPGASARVTISWQGEQTVMEIRIVRITDDQWMVWLLNDGAEVTEANRALREQSWKAISFHDS